MCDFDPKKTSWGDNSKEFLGGKTPAEIAKEEIHKQQLENTLKTVTIGQTGVSAEVLEALRALGIEKK